MPQLTPDICVIGAGSGGLSVAAAAAALGVSVVLIEKDKMGGDCLNVGCVPSKALIAAAETAHRIRNAGQFGITAGEPQVTMSRVKAHIDEIIATIAPNDSVERFTALGAMVLKGEAKFLDARTVVLGGDTIKARRFVIATGSRPAIPPIPGLVDLPYLTNETIFQLTKRPEHLLVLGGGPIGVELAQAMRRLGAQVTLIEAKHILPREDAEAAAIIRTALRADGVALEEQATVIRAEADGAKCRLVLSGVSGNRTIEGTHLLVAAGRKATIDGLGLEAAGVKVDARGIVTNTGLKTSNPRIYAIGDCASGGAGGLQFTHVANYHAGLVIRNALFRAPVKSDMTIIPRVTYCDPEVASVGLSESEARQAGVLRETLRWPFAENDRAQATRQTAGMVKLMVGKKGIILGATMIGSNAGELITPWTMAVAKRMTITDMAGFVIPYPTLSEVGKRAAVTHFARLASHPNVRRLIKFLRWFG
jgi:pyruvate/2-oxoglutarate dehydrogenase complex dihydrolipoamide dehydrogenase (E3) component